MQYESSPNPGLGSSEVVVMLASLISHTMTDDSDTTPLHCAARHGYANAVGALAGMGADLEVRDSPGTNTLTP